MTTIILLILLGIILLCVELFLLPGVTVAGIGALLLCGFAVYRTFVLYGNVAGIIALCVIFILSIVALIIGLRSQTWKRFTLKTNIDSKSQASPEQENVKIGDCGTSITRLAPIGKVMINGKSYEAKSIDSYIDQQSEVEVVDFDNFTIVVRRK